MSRAQLTILTNICLIEDLETQRVVMQYRSPETNRWSGYAFPGGDCVIIMTGANNAVKSRI